MSEKPKDKNREGMMKRGQWRPSLFNREIVVLHYFDDDAEGPEPSICGMVLYWHTASGVGKQNNHKCLKCRNWKEKGR